MTDALLALVPAYGAWLIVVALLLSCLALPVPSSILVLAAGAFAATGDLVLWQIQLAAFAGFVTGDQIAYTIGRRGGSRWMARVETHAGARAVTARARALLDRHGATAVFLARTVVSPLGPYTGYLSGALALSWRRFTIAAVAGALCWCVGYSLIGYLFATRVSQLATMAGKSTGFIVAGVCGIGLLLYLLGRWRADRDADATPPPTSPSNPASPTPAGDG